MQLPYLRVLFETDRDCGPMLINYSIPQWGGGDRPSTATGWAVTAGAAYDIPPAWAVARSNKVLVEALRQHALLLLLTVTEDPRVDDRQWHCRSIERWGEGRTGENENETPTSRSALCIMRRHY